MPFALLGTVVVLGDLPQYGLKRGDVGAVVHVYSPDHVEVEFVRASGHTQALVTLPTDQLSSCGRISDSQRLHSPSSSCGRYPIRCLVRLTSSSIGSRASSTEFVSCATTTRPERATTDTSVRRRAATRSKRQRSSSPTLNATL